MPVALDFCPGGIRPPSAAVKPVMLKVVQNGLIAKALRADRLLAAHSKATAPPSLDDNPSIPFCPSLSVLAEAVFGRLTGCHADTAKSWADAMCLAYYDDDSPFWEGEGATDTTVATDDSTMGSFSKKIKTDVNPFASSSHMKATTVVSLLKAIDARQQQLSEAGGTPGAGTPRSRRRPCGYVFKRGDIAWNCRSCQTDPTCVICDSCFQASEHTGHEVYFHRTTPGGCCDCGDAEAWKVDGCCEEHRPYVNTDATMSSASAASENAAANGPISNSEVDPTMEAVRMAEEGYQTGVEIIRDSQFPPRLLAALGIVIGAAVNAIVDAVDGAGVGADPIQWRMRWADEAARLVNEQNKIPFASTGESSGSPKQQATPATFFEGDLPDGYFLDLRLHNDDVHTFDEVIDALHEPRQLRRHNSDSSGSAVNVNQSLVPVREHATDMTHHVDADGQVRVKQYTSITEAMKGYRRLKSRGLHCAVISSAQSQLEFRARALTSWLTELSAAHPVASTLVVHALVQVRDGNINNSADYTDFAGVHVWPQARMIPEWAGMNSLMNEEEYSRKRFEAFPPQLNSSYVTTEEAELLHGIALSLNANAFCELTGASPDFYASVPYRLPPQRYRKSPHALWGTLPALYSDPIPPESRHPLLHRLATGDADHRPKNSLTESVFVVDTDLRKQQEADRITMSVFPHKLPGLNMISGIGTIRATEVTAARPPMPSPMDLRHLLATCSFRAPASPILLLLLLDPYPTKQMRAGLHALFLSLLTDSRFRSRFAGAIGIAYRPLSTLFCAGVGTEADTPLHFTVQIFTAGSLIRALGSAIATEKLLLSDQPIPDGATTFPVASIGVFSSPIAHTIVRSIHTNLLGATKEVNMILNNTASANDFDSDDDKPVPRNDNLLPALTYVAGEHPLMTPLPAAPDDGFLDSRSTRHKRLPHLLRDLEYVIETPGTAIRLLLPQIFPVYQGPSLSSRGEDILTFPSVYSRMLRLAQGMDPQKRKISGGHVEYEQNRWLEAFGLSLNFAGTRDALTENPIISGSAAITPISGERAYLPGVREAVGNVIASLLREIKLWLYREGMLETGLQPAHGSLELAQAEALQRSTLHVSGSRYDISDSEISMGSSVNAVALACATGVKMTESQLTLIENALKAEAAERMYLNMAKAGGAQPAQQPSIGPVMGDWLRVPHSPLAGDSLSFHLPLHRALAKSVRSVCSVLVPTSTREAHPGSWWKIPVLDSDMSTDALNQKHHPLVPLIRSTLRSSNCRVVWSSGPECSSPEAQRRRSRSRTVSANIAVAKVIHSIADHPIRCIAAAQQIERHLWARNGSSVAGMAMNYSSTPLCRSFRDLDILLVQLSASGMSCGLGARRVFALLLSRFSMDGYLCDPERRVQVSAANSGAYGSVWINPPRLQDPDHAVVLSESLFATLCVVVSELPPPPAESPEDDSSLRQTVRRELLHALAAEPRSHSEAMTAASASMSRREEAEGSSGAVEFRKLFTEVLHEVGVQKGQRSSRAASGPPSFELKPSCCDEYDPTFFHLRRQEHQHAMDVVARLRKRKFGEDKDAADRCCLPIVCAPPRAHPRFLPCRLLLHLQSMDAAIRRSLLFALTGGSWLPPPDPEPTGEIGAHGEADPFGISSSTATAGGDIPVTTFARRVLHAKVQSSSSFPVSRRPSSGNEAPPFSKEVVAASSVSFLEVLQLLTLQVHTLEECASLHRTLPDLDDESRQLSSGLSINSYLRRLVSVPESLMDVWALKPHPEGPLDSKGSGERRGSILGLMIALYEHRSDHAALLDEEGGDNTEEDHGGARALATSGLKFLLRFVNSLVDGAPSVGTALKSATSGIPIQQSQGANISVGESMVSSWTIDSDVQGTIRGMLEGLPDLWPKERQKSSPNEKNSAKNKEAQKAAQMRVMEMMKRKQAAFAATIAPSEQPNAESEGQESESDLCIICRCDDTDGENNGPLGYLGHVQRSRVAQMRETKEGSDFDGPRRALFSSYRVVGHMGCQVSSISVAVPGESYFGLLIMVRFSNSFERLRLWIQSLSSVFPRVASSRF